MRFLVFTLHGPLAAWGEAAPGDVRPSNLHPTRSGLLGLLAAALGLRRSDEEAHRALAADLRFGLRVLSPGVPVVDFHTAQLIKPAKRWQPRTRTEQLDRPRHRLMTVPSRRDYRADALVRVATWSEAEAPRWSLEALAAALERPAFTLYLGRKACPPDLPLGPEIVDAPTLKAALEPSGEPTWTQFLPERKLAGRGVEGEVGFFWEATGRVDAGVEPTQSFERRDDPVSRTRRTFQARWEAFAPYEPPNEEARDAFESPDTGT